MNRSKLSYATRRIRYAKQRGSKRLDLSGLSLTELPASLGQLTHLQQLYLSDNQLTTLPESLGLLTRLRILSVSGNQLTTLPECIGQFTELEELYLDANQLTILPESLGQLIQLRLLYLHANFLTTLPDSIGKLTRLKRLVLRQNNLKKLPSSIGGLAQLQELDLARNNLRMLPASIGKLNHLQELEAGSNRIKKLPKSIGQLIQLRALSLESNQLMTLPETIGHLIRLQNLFLTKNQLTTLPESIGELNRLEALSLAFNNLETLPESIGQLTQLLLLSLSENQLTTLPMPTEKWTQLDLLDLSYNRFSAIPKSLEFLSNLQDLNLCANELATLPEFIGRLIQLRLLDLSNNELVRLPESLKNLISLEVLFLHGNDKLNIPPEILGPAPDEQRSINPRDILDYYFRALISSHPLNEAKLILVGRGGAGKTSIVNRLVNGRFDRNQKKTEGIQRTEWKVILNGNEDVRLNIWDFGGQEIMHATHQFFLTERSLYILVLSGRSGAEEADAEYWLRIIESFGSDSPVIIVLNKMNEQPFDLNRRGLQQKFPSIREFVKTDCEDGTGFEGLCNSIRRETDRLEHLRDDFPANWFEIKNHLASMTENYLTFEEYRNICKVHGVQDEDAQRALAHHLHCLGIALNFRDEVRLREMHVLNPHWVTNGIYTILNSRELADRNGEIRLRDLSRILDGSAYPNTMCRFLFNLMKKFDLCFSFPDDDTHYLIPQLIDRQEPDYPAKCDTENCLYFQYHYPVIPEGLLPRFIVRTHVLSTGLHRWRTGVILQFEGNMAVVKADVQDKKVTISVSGPVPGRRRLLAVIRSDFERIHRDIKSLNPESMVPLPNYPDVVVPYNDLLVMETQGIEGFPKVVGSNTIMINVTELLNGVDLQRVRQKDKGKAMSRFNVKLFYSYSHKDETLRDQLETHLKLLQRQNLIESWHDRMIEAGDEWKQKIDENLEAADIILLLVSADFIASDYCYEKEMKRALEKHEKREARVIPVIVRDVNWRIAPFAKLQALPKDGLAVTNWPNRDTAWRNVSEGIEKVIERMRTKS